MKRSQKYLTKLNDYKFKISCSVGNLTDSCREFAYNHIASLYTLQREIAEKVIKQHNLPDSLPERAPDEPPSQAEIDLMQTRIMEHINKLRFYQPWLMAFGRIGFAGLWKYRHTMRKVACKLVAEVIMVTLSVQPYSEEVFAERAAEAATEPMT
jgi:hypothetical protein